MINFIALDGKDHVLLIHEKNHPEPKLYKCPGGKNKGKEKPEETLLRELGEELGLKTCIKKMQKEKSYIFLEKYDLGSSTNPHVGYYFRCRITEEEYRQELFPDGTIEEVILVPAEREIVQNYPMVKSHQEAILYALEIQKKKPI